MGKSRFVEPGVSNLFSFAPNHTVYLKLENLDVCLFSLPGLLVFHAHHTFCNFHSDWILQDLPIFTFQPGVDSWFTVRQFCIKCHASATCCPCPPYICNIQVEWLDYAGFANFLFLTSQSAVSLANQSTPSQPKLLPQFVYGISPQNPPHPP